MNAAIIDQDITLKDKPKIRAAFDYLIGLPSPDEIEGVSSLEEMVHLLARVALALRTDTGLLPKASFDTLMARWPMFRNQQALNYGGAAQFVLVARHNQFAKEQPS